MQHVAPDQPIPPHWPYLAEHCGQCRILRPRARLQIYGKRRTEPPVEPEPVVVVCGAEEVLLGGGGEEEPPDETVISEEPLL